MGGLYWDYIVVFVLVMGVGVWAWRRITRGC